MVMLSDDDFIEAFAGFDSNEVYSRKKNAAELKALEDAKSLLGLSIPLSELSVKKVTQAYHKMSRIHHPDKHTKASSATQAASAAAFQKIVPAKDCLLGYLEENRKQFFRYNLWHSDFNATLWRIRNKSFSMTKKAKHDPNYTEAAKAADTLYRTLKKAKIDFFALDDMKAGQADFIKTCRDAIADARPELEKHRGWSQVFLDLFNVLAFIGTAGIANGVAKYKWDSYRLFTVETDSAKKLRECDEALDTFEQAAPAA
jgi:hypothetical protein